MTLWGDKKKFSKTIFAVTAKIENLGSWQNLSRRQKSRLSAKIAALDENLGHLRKSWPSAKISDVAKILDLGKTLGGRRKSQPSAKILAVGINLGRDQIAGSSRENLLGITVATIQDIKFCTTNHRKFDWKSFDKMLFRNLVFDQIWFSNSNVCSKLVYKTCWLLRESVSALLSDSAQVKAMTQTLRHRL